MGIETSVDLGGSESSFTSAIIAIEELAKVDPSVSVMCDVHNTLVNTIFRKYATKAQQDEFLPKLASSSVRSSSDGLCSHALMVSMPSWEASASLNLHLARMHSRFK